MHPADNMARTLAAILVIVIAFAWISFAYVMGTKTERMILHPIVPIFVILLLLNFRNDASVRYVVTVALLFIFVWLLVRLRSVFLPFIIGFALAYIVNLALAGLQTISIPLPKRRRLHFSRGGAVAILAVLLAAVIIFFAVGVVPQLVEQASAMRRGIASFYEEAKDRTVTALTALREREYPFRDRLSESWRASIDGAIGRANEYMQQRLPAAARRASEILTGILAGLSSGLIGTMGQISSAFFILIVFIYAVQAFASHMENLAKLIPECHRQRVVRYAGEIDANMRAFLKGQVAIITIISIISIIAYSIIRIPFALLVGLLAGLCNAIPAVGPIIGGGIAVLAAMVGFVAANYGLAGFLVRLALVVGVAFGIQLLDNALISPKIMSSAVEVHPLVVIFAVLLSASLIGVWGAVLAIPGVVVFKAVVKVSGEIRAETSGAQV